MKNVNSKQVNAAIKKNKKNLLAMIIFIIIGLLFIGYYAYESDKISKKDAVSFHDVIAEGKTDIGLKVKVDISAIPYVFAEYDKEEKTNKYYFLMDDNYLYIGFLDYDTYQKLNTENIYEHPITVEGFTKKIPDDVIDLAIEVYNEESEEELLNEGNYKLYIGELYLDTTENVNNYSILFVLGVISIGIGLIMGVIYWKQKSQIKKMISKYTENEWLAIENEIQNHIIIGNPKLYLYLTENYIVDIHHGLNIIEYKDIIWIYPYQLKQYGVTTNQSIIIYTSDKKKHVIANLGGFSKKNKELLEDIMNLIVTKNKQVLCGYTKENKTQIKNLYGIK